MPYVPIAEAADRLGVSQDTIKRRIKVGQIPAQREPRGSGFRWLVEVPEDAGADATMAGAGAGVHAGAESPDDLASAALELAALRARVEGLEQTVEILERHNTELAADRDRWHRQAETLERIAERAQVLQERAQPAALPAGVTEAPAESEHTGPQAATPQGRSEGLWGAILRLARGR